MGESAVFPAEARRRVLEQHKTIRDRVSSLEDLACRVASGSADHGRLTEEVEALLSLLGTHMRFEDSVLPDLLREADAWGDERVDRYYAEHAQQRQVIGNLLDVVSQRDELERALLALGFCTLLRRDMDGEESFFLDERVLRDDPVVIEAEPE